MAYSLSEMSADSEQKPKVRLARDVPPPPTITEEVRAQLAVDSREWRAEVAAKVAAIEAVTSKDLRVRAR